MPAAPPKDAPLAIDGSNAFDGGMDSFTNPRLLPQNSYALGINICRRGGIAQTRPGTKTVFSNSCGYPQFLTMFQPTGSVQFLVWAVKGKVYASPAPFTTYSQIPGIQFYENAKYIAWAATQQTTSFDATGNIIVLAQPRAVLMMQDGFSRAAYWDGTVGAHINPGPSGQVDSQGNPLVLPNTFGTPLGLWMAWAGNRLWVSRGSTVFASDIGNPLVFSEQQYLSNLQSFTMPEPVTGMVQPVYGSPLIVFGANSRTTLQAEVQDRTQWSAMINPPFQYTAQGIGCLSHRSIVRQYGLIWWYSQGGLVNLNYATQNTIDSFFPYQDDQMIVSKANMSPDRSGVAGCGFEHYMLLSVPSGSLYNQHTWCMDQTQGTTTWDGYWKGWRPVEWATGIVNGQQRCFFISLDEDGVSRIWEAFQPDRTDNGQPITCALMTKIYSFQETQGSQRANEAGQFNYSLNASMDSIKQYRFTQIYVAEALGQVDLWGGFFGLTGGAQNNLVTRIEADVGDLGLGNQSFFSFRPQTRSINSSEAQHDNTECNPGGVESETEPYYRDRGFGYLMMWSGRMGVTGLRMFSNVGAWDDYNGQPQATTDAEQTEGGDPAVTEVPPRVLNLFGCGSSTQDFSNVTPFPKFVATSTATVQCPGSTCGGTITAIAVANSRISQLDANKKSAGIAVLNASALLQCF